MMKIGDFSRLTGVPIKTLRYYAEIGLLTPACIEDNHYRYYGLEQLLEINHILELKESGFTLNEISNKKMDIMNNSDLICLYQKKLDVAEKELQYTHMKIANLKRKISELLEKERKKVMLNIKQGPNHSTLMGVIKGVSDHFSMDLSQPMLYGLTGHGFMINIHKELCTSGPYCYDLKSFTELLRNIGIEMTDHGFFSDKSTLEERQHIEKILKEHLDQNKPCAIVNLEYQLVSGYDNTGFFTSQPWSNDFPPSHLTYETWDEIKDDIHMCVFTFDQIKEKNMKDRVKAALQFAVALHQTPKDYTNAPYYTGLEAYDVFIKAVSDGHGGGQGNRWNATVWGECRNMASAFFDELKGIYPNLKDMFSSLSHDYKLIGESLIKLSESSLPIGPRVEVLKDIKETERLAIEKIEGIIEKL